jgi:hypothetical protein
MEGDELGILESGTLTQTDALWAEARLLFVEILGSWPLLGIDEPFYLSINNAAGRLSSAHLQHEKRHLHLSLQKQGSSWAFRQEQSTL